MSPLALLWVWTAALLHAGWNLILKRADERYLVAWWSVLVSFVLLAPAAAYSGWPERTVWPYLLASAAVEALYMAALAAAYNLTDFSLVYPIAHGSAPAFLALWAWLFLGERISPLGGLGIALLVTGLIVVGSSGLAAARNRIGMKAGLPGIGLAVLTALLISIYSTIDGAAVRLTPATPYTVLMLGMSGVFFTPFALRRAGWRKSMQVARRSWRALVVIGVANVLAYTLVLNAYAIAPVSYAGAMREISVVFGALAGWKLLGEPLGRLRVIGAVVIFAGVLLIAAA